MCLGAGDFRNSLIPGWLGRYAAQLDRCTVYVLLCGFHVEIICYEWVRFRCTVAQSKKRDFWGGLFSQTPEAGSLTHRRRPVPTPQRAQVARGEPRVRGDPGPGAPGGHSQDGVIHVFRYSSLFQLCAFRSLFSARKM